MKVIYPSNISSVSADEENASFPAANVEDDHPKKVWKATSNDATLTVNVAGGGAVAVFNTNASTITITIIGGMPITWLADDITWLAGDIEWYDTDPSISTELYELDASGVGSLWAEYTELEYAHSLELLFEAAAGTTIEAGVVRAGTLHDFEEPAYGGISEGLVDYSIVKELNNGAVYTRLRDVVRSFSFTLIEALDPDFWTFMLQVAQLAGPAPQAWRILENSDWEWVVFARLADMPHGRHFNNSYSKIAVNLREVV